MEKLTIILEPMTELSEFANLQDTIENHAGVGEVAAIFKDQKLVIQFNLLQTSEDELKQLISDQGYQIKSTNTER
jgi:copper chaperone CopZ